MSRTIAVIWHASFCIAAGVLYFLFVLPRWWELMGDTPHALGTVLRIVVGALIGLAALPVVFTLLRTRRPEFGTPQMALTLRTWSIVLHVLAGVLILGSAVSEIWLSLDAAGQWLFGIYGAAAAIALLGMFAFYLAYVAELPPPPPKPLKAKKTKQRRRRKGAEEDAATDEDAADGDADDDKPAEVTAETTPEAEEAAPEAPEAAEAPPAEEAEESEPSDEVPAPAAVEETTDADGEPTEAQATNGKLRNRRPSGKDEPTRRRRRRLRGGVALED